MDIMLPDAVLHALVLLNTSGYDAYIVGGCVRDSMLGCEPDDWDIATSATPDEIQEVFREYRIMDYGLQHGTLTIVVMDLILEITTFRMEGAYSDGRHPDTVQFTRSLHEDLQRRDFTVNAMAYHPFEGVIDLYHGQEDLANGIIRCVGEPEKRFSEDALRILRALRFAALLDFEIEAHTEAALVKLAPALTCISMERVSVEVCKLLRSRTSAGRVITKYRDVLAVVFPEIRKVTDFSLLAIPVPMMHARFAALFWKTNMEAYEVIEALQKLRLDKATVRIVGHLISCREMPLNTTYDLLRMLNRITPERVNLYLALREADESIVKRVKSLLDENACYNIPILKIDGEDVIAAGIEKGPDVGRVLYAVLDAVMDGRCQNRKEDLLKWIEENEKPVQ